MLLQPNWSYIYKDIETIFHIKKGAIHLTAPYFLI